MSRHTPRSLGDYSRALWPVLLPRSATRNPRTYSPLSAIWVGIGVVGAVLPHVATKSLGRFGCPVGVQHVSRGAVVDLSSTHAGLVRIGRVHSRRPVLRAF
jgi:hypothetical protein